VTGETIYDHPLYYDILFGWDRSLEADFYDRTLRRLGLGEGAALLEVGCGTGHVALRLAARGWQVTGLDIRPGMLALLEQKAALAGQAVRTLQADMTHFAVLSPFAGAYNPMSSFRLLQSDGAAADHLTRMAAALEPCGLYVLDMDFVAHAEVQPVTTDEAWDMERDGITVRAENDRIVVTGDGGARVLQWGMESHLRGYTVASFSDLVAANASFAIEAWHPETDRETGVSAFSEEPQPPPASGLSPAPARSTATATATAPKIVFMKFGAP
jgi:SAM-dependent methyltransferase